MFPPPTEVKAASVISFQINAWHAVAEHRGIFHLKSTMWLNWPVAFENNQDYLEDKKI